METRAWHKENQSLELFLSPDIVGLSPTGFFRKVTVNIVEVN